MSLDKSIKHGKEHRKPYRGVKAYCTMCRNHGSCDYCRDNRLHSDKKRLERLKDMDEEFHTTYQSQFTEVKNIKHILNVLKTATDAKQINKIKEEIAEIIPAVSIMFNYNQRTSYHQYDLWEHCVHTVLFLPRDIDDNMLYLAALLHDIGKPYCQCDGKNKDDQNKHYYGHPLKSYQVVKDEVFEQLKENDINLSDEEKQRLLYYVKYHDDRVSLRPKHLLRHLKIASFKEFQNLMLLQVADAKAHVLFPIIKERIDICSQWAGAYGEEIYKNYKEKKYGK